MASDQRFVEFVCAQVGGSPGPAWKKMFGEYALYLDGKVVALVCDNRLFVKPTSPGRALLGAVSEGPSELSPYPGAKPHLLIDAAIDDRDLMRRLFEATARALPAPKAKPAARKSTEAKKPKKPKKPKKEST